VQLKALFNLTLTIYADASPEQGSKGGKINTYNNRKNEAAYVN
jgi:hypothetical protein